MKFALPRLVTTMGFGTMGGNLQAALPSFNETAGQGAAPRKAVTFEQAALQYIVLSEPRWGAHAVTTTKSVIRKHLIAKLGHLPADKLTAKEIQTFLDEMVRSNASDSLLKKAVTHLRGILDLAQESGALALNPMRSRTSKIGYRPQRPASERHLSLEECAALLSELAGRDLLIARMFIQLGLRPQELFALRQNDLRGEFIRIDEVLIKGRIKKIGSEEAALGVYVPPDLLSQLANWMKSTGAQDTGWLFPASRSRGSSALPPIGQHQFRNRILRRAAEKAGVPDVDLLALRRTCGSFFAHLATAQDTLAQMRRLDPAYRAEFVEQGLPKSLKRAADKIEAQILKATNQAKKSEDSPNRPTSRPTSGAKARRGLSPSR
jgi:integrase